MSDLPTLRRAASEEAGHQEPPPQAESPVPQRRRFASESINDLIFWGIHLSLVAISLAIVWYKIDRTNQALQTLLEAQAKEVVLVQRQVTAVETQTALVKQQEREKEQRLKINEDALQYVLTSVTRIQADIRKNLEQTEGINQSVLEVAQQTREASLKAAQASSSAANAATSAVGAANAAAARSSATQGLVKQRVVTSEDKLALKAQERKLAQKQQQLTKTIKQVKKTGPTLWQKLTH